MTSTEPAPRTRARARTRLTTAAFAALLAATAAVLLQVAPEPSARLGFPLTVALAAAFFVAEGWTVHIPARRDSHTISLVEIPLVIALVYALPAELLAARLAGSCLALLLIRRQRNALKLGFNVAAFSLETSAATVVFLGISSGAAPTEAATWFGVGAAVLTFQTVGALAVSGVIWINDARPSLRGFMATYGIGLVGATMAGAWGLVTIAATQAAPLAAVPLAALAGGLYLLLGVFGRLRRRHKDLEIMHSFTTALDAADDADTLPALLLDVVNAHFMTSMSAVISETGTSTEILVLDDHRGLTARSAPPEFAFEDIAAVTSAGPAMLDGIATGPLESLIELTVTNGAFVPIPATRAILLLGNSRPGHTLRDGDLDLLRTLGSHAGSVFERHRLFGALEQEVELRQYQALHDSLTGLANRTAFLESVEHLLRSPRTDHHTAVLLLDVDDFKRINDTLSHRAGDQVLIEMAARLRDVIRSADIIARVGGDEFAAAISIGSEADAIAIAHRIKQGLQHPFISAGLRVEIGASIGIALDGSSAITLLRRADIAMYAAKEIGSGIEIYRDEIDHYDAPRLELAGELRSAIEAGHVKVYYQPKVRTTDGSIAGFEALARWLHPSRGMVPPDDFIPIAERTGLMAPLTEHVLETALLDAQSWSDRDWTVSVNFSPRTLATLSHGHSITDVLARTGTGADRLVVEVTESATLPDQHGSRTAMHHLHDLGAAISIDDFGTGYSSMSRLRALPISELKIDRSFVSIFQTDPGARAIVETTLTLATRLGLRTVAEGVQHRSAVDELRRLGADEIQGYVYAPPLPIGDLWDWIAHHERRHGLSSVG